MSKLGFKLGAKVRRVAGRYGHRYDVGDTAVVTAIDPSYTIIRLDHGIWSPVEFWELVETQPLAPLFLGGVKELVAQITYKPGWTVEVHEEHGLVGWQGRKYPGRVYIQLSVNAFAEASMDSVKRDGTRAPWKSARRYLTPSMCKQELVGVVFDLIKAAELHEVHEWFRYKNASIYNPHLDPDALAELARKKSSFVVRENAMSMVEEAA